MIESHGITIIRANPDAADFDMNRLINQMHKHITQSNKEKLEKEKLEKRKRNQNKKTKKPIKTNKSSNKRIKEKKKNLNN